jgi:alanine-synthesizing transaminase
MPARAQEKMRFSHRTDWNTEETALARAHRQRLAAGLPLADLTASNPTRCGFTYPPDLLAPLADPRALDYDPQPRGSLRARQAVCAYYADHGAPVDPAQIVLTTSTSEAYSFLFRLLCDPGDEILVPQPSYPLFDFLADLDDVNLKPCTMVYHDGWQIDPEGLRRALTPQTRALVLVHPNNPTGHFTKPWEAEELARLCRDHSLALIVDEVFLDYPFALATSGPTDSSVPHPFAGSCGEWVGEHDPRVPHPRRAFVLAPRVGEHDPEPSVPQTFAFGLTGVPVFVVSGLSKIAGLPQMKAAWIVSTVPEPERENALARLEIIADTFLAVNAPSQCALPAWLESRLSIQEQIRVRIAANLAELDAQLARVPASNINRLALEGGWYAILRIPAIAPDETTVLALLERGVWVHPGYFFGFPPSGWLVLSLLPPVTEFRSGVTALVDYLHKNQRSNITG